VDWYGPWSAKGQHITDEGQQHLRSLLSVGLHDLVIITRPDAVFKPTLPCALKAANKTKALFIFQCWTAAFPWGDKLPSGRHCIADTMAVIPAWAFPTLRDTISAGALINHNAMDYMVPKVGWCVTQLVRASAPDATPRAVGSAPSGKCGLYPTARPARL
jgi:hypothetical protein